jgi:hypothetical protein
MARQIRVVPLPDLQLPKEVLNTESGVGYVSSDLSSAFASLKIGGVETLGAAALVATDLGEACLCQGSAGSLKLSPDEQPS